MFISFGQYIGLIILTIIMIGLIIYLTLTKDRDEKQTKLRNKIADRFAQPTTQPQADQKNYVYLDDQQAAQGQAEGTNYTNQDAYYTNQTQGQAYQNAYDQENDPYYQHNTYTDDSYSADPYSNQNNAQDPYDTQQTQQYGQTDYYTQRQSQSHDHNQAYDQNAGYEEAQADPYSNQYYANEPSSNGAYTDTPYEDVGAADHAQSNEYGHSVRYSQYTNNQYNQTDQYEESQGGYDQPADGFDQTHVYEQADTNEQANAYQQAADDEQAVYTDEQDKDNQ